MDSLSQIVLGAAVGEVVLGKRLGNRAMVFFRGTKYKPPLVLFSGCGAVAGTLPDMDVLGQYFLNELDNLAFHRGISHSLLASVLGSLVFGWATHQLYRSSHHATVAMAAKAFAVVVVGFVVNFLDPNPVARWMAATRLVHPPSGGLALVEARPTALLQRSMGTARRRFERVGAPVLLGVRDPHRAGLFHHLRNPSLRPLQRPARGVGHHCRGRPFVHRPVSGFACSWRRVLRATTAGEDAGTPPGWD